MARLRTRVRLPRPRRHLHPTRPPARSRHASASTSPRLLECASFDEVFDCRGPRQVRVRRGGEGELARRVRHRHAGQLRVQEPGHHPGRSRCSTSTTAWCCIPTPKLEDVDRRGLARPGPRAVPPLPERAAAGGRATITTSSTAESARLAAEDAARRRHRQRLRRRAARRARGRGATSRTISATRRRSRSSAARGIRPCSDGDALQDLARAVLAGGPAPARCNMILSEFAYAGINLSMIQSRPTKQALGDYMFFVELEGVRERRRRCRRP